MPNVGVHEPWVVSDSVLNRLGDVTADAATRAERWPICAPCPTASAIDWPDVVGAGDALDAGDGAAGEDGVGEGEAVLGAVPPAVAGEGEGETLAGGGAVGEGLASTARAAPPTPGPSVSEQASTI